MAAGIDRLVFGGLNHLLVSESWASERLRPHAGAQVLIEGGLLRLFLRIDEHGLLQPGDSECEPDVRLILPADTPARFILDRDSLFSSVKLSGVADVAESLAFVFRNLKWDVEADLAGLLGDIPARRLVALGKKFAEESQSALQKLGGNLAEYVSEESDVLVPRRDVEAFGRAVDSLRDDVARLEKRISRL